MCVTNLGHPTTGKTDFKIFISWPSVHQEKFTGRNKLIAVGSLPASRSCLRANVARGYEIRLQWCSVCYTACGGFTVRILLCLTLELQDLEFEREKEAQELSVYYISSKCYYCASASIPSLRGSGAVVRSLTKSCPCLSAHLVDDSV